jgi:dTDP-4-dehydrorhamnose reductase
MIRTAVIGADGQLGTEVCTLLSQSGHEVLALTEREVDVTDAGTLSGPLEGEAPEVVVNTAALTDVPRCERDPQRAFAVNAVGARNVARAVRRIGAYLIHVSTDYVFSGEKGAPYVESDAPGPLSVYGKTKLEGELFVASEAPDAAVLRTCGLYGKTPSVGKGGNFVETMLRLAGERDEVRVVDDETVSPTSAVDLARQIVRLAQTPLAGIVHAAAHGACSWFEFASEIFRLSGVTTPLRRARPGEFSGAVRRPRYSALENAVLVRHGLDLMKSWQEGLAEYLAAR